MEIKHVVSDHWISNPDIAEVLIIKSSNLSLSLLNWIGESCEKEKTWRTWSDASMTDSFFSFMEELREVTTEVVNVFIKAL